MISDIVEDYRNQISNANVRLIHKSEKTNNDDYNIPIFLEADKSRLTQVISNLLDNAIKFTREGTISIALKKKMKEESDSQQEEAIITIEDTGTGIPKILPRLFSKFATESQTGGTGLRLFISKSIIETHGGKIKGENYSYNMKRGARFTFSIPLSSHNNRHQ